MIILCDMKYELLEYMIETCIFRKENTMLRLLGCTLTRDLSRMRYPDSIGIL